MFAEDLDFPPIDVEAARAPQPPMPLNPAPSKTPTALALADIKPHVLARFGDWRTPAAALVAKYKDVVFTDLETGKGYKALTAAIAEARAPRFAAQAVDDAFPAELKKLRAAVTAEKDAVVACLAPIEAALVAQRDAYDTKVANEKAERERIEAERIAAHQSRLAAIRACVGKAQGISSDRIALGIDKVDAISTDRATWEEFTDEATAARAETLDAMRAMFASTKVAEEAEAAAAEQRRQQAIVAQQQADEAKRLKDAADLLAVQQKEAADKLDADRAQFERERAEFLAAQAKVAEPAPEAIKPVQTITEGRDSQHVLKAEAETPDATDRENPVNASPSVGSMGAGQPADAGAAETVHAEERAASPTAPAAPARPIEEQLAECRIALADALELLEGWILTKCPKRYVDEHMNKVAELRKQGGI